MTDLERTLGELARLRSGAEPIVSLYLDVRWADEQQRERVRLFVQDAARRALGHYADGAPGRDALERTLRRAQAWVTGLTGQEYEVGRQGVALFALESGGLWRELAFGRPFRNDLATDAVPHLGQLASLAHSARPVLVAAPGPHGAELLRVTAGEIDVEQRLRRPAAGGGEGTLEPGAARRGSGEGPAARSERAGRDRRRDERLARRDRRDAVGALTALFDRSPGAAVVLMGVQRSVAAFERDLPERVRARVVARLRRPPEWETGEGARRAGALAAADEGAAARARLDHAPDHLVGEALRGGLAVVGPEDVVLAANEGRVHTLLVEEHFRRAGWRCDNCDALGANAESAETCPYCGGDLRVVRDLGEALVARALAGGGRVAVVPHDRKLHGYRGVGAFLRQTAATGLRGASARWPPAPGASQP